ncbi:hypothetical protein J6590_042103 [Homalodisca vitripennis]|nr:hypothetical protein J6590_042103 [Homalodisca vitripennis]
MQHLKSDAIADLSYSSEVIKKQSAAKNEEAQNETPPSFLPSLFFVIDYFLIPSDKHVFRFQEPSLQHHQTSDIACKRKNSTPLLCVYDNNTCSMDAVFPRESTCGEQVCR